MDRSVVGDQCFRVTHSGWVGTKPGVGHGLPMVQKVKNKKKIKKVIKIEINK